MQEKENLYDQKIAIVKKIQEKEQEVSAMEFRLKYLPENQKIARGKVILLIIAIFVCASLILTVISTASIYDAFSLIRQVFFPIIFAALIAACVRELLRQLKNIAVYTQEQLTLPARLANAKASLDKLLIQSDTIEKQLQNKLEKN